MYKNILCFFLVFFSLNLFSQENFKENLINKIQLEHKTPLTNYKNARTILFGDIYLTSENTIIDVYCNITFDSKNGVGKNRIPDPEKVNCEHTWPQSKFCRRTCLPRPSCQCQALAFRFRLGCLPLRFASGNQTDNNRSPRARRRHYLSPFLLPLKIRLC